VDRLFLTWYSSEAVAGAVTALFTTWTLMGLCLGTGEYLTTFVAQYFGAKRFERIGPALWQGVYFSLLAGVVIAACAPLAEPIFAFAGHAPHVRGFEVEYARILLIGGFPIVLMATLSTFFAGRGETRIVLIANIVGTLVNAVLDYLWIFGRGGFPRAGVAGAAWATVISQGVGALLYIAIILRRENRTRFATLSGWRFESRLFARLLRFGFPAGLQYSLEIGAFSLFMMIVGRIGTTELAASGIAFNLNMIVFMPMIGLGIGVSSIVGRYLGANDSELAERATWSAFGMSLVYMSVCGALYVLAPGLLLGPYSAHAGADFVRVREIAVVLLRFVAVYSIFDMFNVIFAAGLKGAGDTRYPLTITVALSWAAMLIPAYFLCLRAGGGVYTAWCTASAYVVLLGLLMMRRFRAGAWKDLRVIEPHVPELDGASPVAVA
jgi:MATE family multidrug resistance protein